MTEICFKGPRSHLFSVLFFSFIFFLYPRRLQWCRLKLLIAHNTGIPKSASLTLCLQPPAKTQSSVPVLLPWKGTKTRWTQKRQSFIFSSKWSEHLADSLVTNLEEGTVPFVTSHWAVGCYSIWGYEEICLQTKSSDENTILYNPACQKSGNVIKGGVVQSIFWGFFFLALMWFAVFLKTLCIQNLFEQSAFIR